MNAASNYIISGGGQGKSRLDTLAHVLATYTNQLLDEVGLREGASFLDNGCGGGHVSIMVGEKVGSKGRVTAVDFDEAILDLAQMDAMAKGLGNIYFLPRNAYDLDFYKEFDFAYARFLLSHLADPLLALQKMVQAAKPGGIVLVEDIEFSRHYSHRFHPAFDQYVRLYSQAVKERGGNAEIGPQLPELFKQVGLTDIRFDTIQPAFSEGAGKWMAYLTLERIKQSLLQAGFIDEEPLKTLQDDLKAFTEDTGSIISLPRIFRVWGKVKEPND